MTDREKMVEELKRLVPSRMARAIHLRRSDEALARTLDRIRADTERVRREGHIATSGIGLRPL